MAHSALNHQTLGAPFIAASSRWVGYARAHLRTPSIAAVVATRPTFSPCHFSQLPTASHQAQYRYPMTEHLKEILIVTGLLTMAPIASVLIPTTILRLLFGVQNPDDTSIFLTRHWGLLVALVGALLLFSAYHPQIRTPVMVVAAIEKLALAAFILATPLRKQKLLMIIAAGDSLIAIIYLIALSES